MFHSISENPPHRVGKIFCDLSYFGKSTTFAPGREDWNLKKISHTHEKFNVSSFNYLNYIFCILAICPTTSKTEKLQIKKLQSCCKYRRCPNNLRNFSSRIVHKMAKRLQKSKTNENKRRTPQN